MCGPALVALLEGMPVGAVVLSSDGSVLALNPAFMAVTGLQHDVLDLRTAADLEAAVELRDLAGAPMPDGASPLAIALAGGRLDAVPMLVRAVGDGGARPVTCSVVPIGGPDAVVGALLLLAEPAGKAPEQAALEESQAALRVLVADRERVQAEERRRIARDLHDDLQQSLAALNMRLGMAEDVLDSDPAEARQWLEESQRNVMDASKATRRIIEDLRPQGLYHRALVGALGDLVSGFTDRTGVECVFDPVPADMPEPPEEVADCLYRIAQESLTNIAKHADATQVSMQLVRRDDGAMQLRVVDDGRGLDVPTARYQSGAYGLMGMAERVRALNGEMRISGQPGRGTTIEADIPPAPRPPTGRG